MDGEEEGDRGGRRGWFTSRRWLIVCSFFLLLASIGLFLGVWVWIDYSGLACSLGDRPPVDAWGWKGLHDSLAEHGLDVGRRRELAWQVPGHGSFLLPDRDEDTILRFSSYLLVASGLREGERERLWSALRRGEIGTRVAALLLARSWMEEGTALARCRECLDGEGVEVVVALYALPLVTGHRLPESWSTPVNVREVDLDGARVFRAFGGDVEALREHWLEWLAARADATVEDMHRAQLLREVERFSAVVDEYAEREGRRVSGDRSVLEEEDEEKWVNAAAPMVAEVARVLKYPRVCNRFQQDPLDPADDSTLVAEFRHQVALVAQAAEDEPVAGFPSWLMWGHTVK